MAGKNTAVFGIYRNRAGVESAVDALKAAEFRNSDISVLFPENTGTKDFAHYVLMIIALMVRPYGIVGKAIIERI